MCVRRYTAGELARGGYSAKELRGFRDALYKAAGHAGYSAKELREGDVPYSAAELKDAGYATSELKAGGWCAGPLRARG